MGDEPDGEWIYICFCKPKTEFTPVVLSFPSKERCDRGGSDVENHWTENKKPLPVFLKEREMDRLLDDVPFKEDFTGCRDRMVLEMFYATGMRLSELIGLNDVDVDFSAFQIKVTGKRNKQRLIPFGEELRRAMSVYLKIRNEVLPGKAEAFFVLKNGKRMYPGKVYLLVKRNLSKVVSLKKEVRMC